MIARRISPLVADVPRRGLMLLLLLLAALVAAPLLVNDYLLTVLILILYFAYAGQATRAADTYLEAASALRAEEATELRRRAAEQLLLAGHLERGLGVIDSVLRALKMRQTRGGRRALPSIALGRLLVRWRGLRFEARREADVAGVVGGRLVVVRGGVAHAGDGAERRYPGTAPPRQPPDPRAGS